MRKTCAFLVALALGALTTSSAFATIFGGSMIVIQNGAIGLAGKTYSNNPQWDSLYADTVGVMITNVSGPGFGGSGPSATSNLPYPGSAVAIVGESCTSGFYSVSSTHLVDGGAVGYSTESYNTSNCSDYSSE